MTYWLYLIVASPFFASCVFCGMRYYQSRYRLWILAAILLGMLTIPPLYFAYADFFYYS